MFMRLDRTISTVSFRLKASPRARWEIKPGSAIDAAGIDAMYRLRTTVFGIKEAVNPAVDRAWFEDVILRSTEVCRYFAPDGCLVGFWQLRLDARVFAEQRVGIVSAHFAFFDPAWRGRAGMAASVALTFARYAARMRGRPIFGVGVGYPNTWLFAHRHDAPVIADGQAPEGSLEAAVLDHSRAEMVAPGVTGPHPVVRMNTIPELPREHWLKRHANDPVFVEYQRMNPAWREGFGLYGVARITPRFFGSIGLAAARRALRIGR